MSEYRKEKLSEPTKQIIIEACKHHNNGAGVKTDIDYSSNPPVSFEVDYHKILKITYNMTSIYGSSKVAEAEDIKVLGSCNEVENVLEGL